VRSKRKSLSSRCTSRKKKAALEARPIKKEEEELARIKEQHDRKKREEGLSSSIPSIQEGRQKESLDQKQAFAGSMFAHPLAAGASSSDPPSPYPAAFSYGRPFASGPSSAAAGLDTTQRTALQTLRSVIETSDDEKAIALLTLLNWDATAAITACLDNESSVSAALQKVQASKASASVQKAKTTIQVHMEDGHVLQQDFSYDDTLWIVYEFVARKHAHEWGGRSFTLWQSFPKNRIPEEKLNLTLKEAGLVPTGSLDVQLSPAR